MARHDEDVGDLGRAGLDLGVSIVEGTPNYDPKATARFCQIPVDNTIIAGWRFGEFAIEHNY
jgi:hypothetical protein